MKKILFLVTFLLAASSIQQKTVSFPEPIDALSVGFPSDDTQLAIKMSDGWRALFIEKESDPLLKESNLVLFPKPVDRVTLRGDLRDIALHPITVDKKPVSHQLAATTFYRAPRIISRNDWGADEEFLFQGATVEPTQSEAVSSAGTGQQSSKRVDDCLLAQKNSPQDFQTGNTVTHDGSGQTYRWIRRYSPSIKLLVVHHTALTVTGDNRPPAERMRALYEYHANNRGWGDIGYNFVIDEQGNIYEGRSGGDYVVAGHAYCSNVGSMGIALMGNFDNEQPPLEQTKALQWLLQHLGNKYSIDLDRNVIFHGQNMKPIVRHMDLVPTECPGFFLSSVTAQIRSNVIAGNLDAAVSYPVVAAKTYVNKTQQRLAVRLEEVEQTLGRAYYRAKRLVRTADRRGNAQLSNLQQQLSQGTNLQRTRVASQPITRPQRPTGTLEHPVTTTALNNPNNQSPITNNPSQSDTIRIRLSYIDNIATITGDKIGTVHLGIDGTSCVTTGAPITDSRSPITRIDGGNTTLTVSSWQTKWNRFRGVIECSVIDGTLVLINELALEDYLKGLSEQPDTEPPEKQKAFAIAARSYAAYYLQSDQRKFPGMPYDGSDTGASFQNYSGVAYEEDNPQWLRAVEATAGKVITKDGSVVKTAYFSSDDGRTRSPAENGWHNFPFAEVFVSKSDPWCAGKPLSGHGVGMSGCGAEAQALEGKTAETILKYYYTGTVIELLSQR